VPASATKPTEPTALRERALDDLRFIRATMTAATAFTALSGVGFLVIGLGAIATHVVTLSIADPLGRVAAWLVDAAVSVAIGAGTTSWKARRAGQPLLSGPFRKFLLGFAPAIVAGAVLTGAVISQFPLTLLPALWLLLYGAGLVAAGSFSIPLIPAMGASFLAVGTLAAFAPPAWGELLMVAGFGGLHVAFGFVIARRHGG
jgi:hypothetical protein